jgi:uncharacterized protein (DUF952 family)
VIVLHLMPATLWRAWMAGDDYEPASLAAEGFVHCTASDDLMLHVANRFYAGTGDDLVAVALDTDRLTNEVRWEAAAHPDGSGATSGEPLFPHVYGPLDRQAVTGARRIVRDPGDGRFVGYAAL